MAPPRHPLWFHRDDTLSGRRTCARTQQIQSQVPRFATRRHVPLLLVLPHPIFSAGSAHVFTVVFCGVFGLVFCFRFSFSWFVA